MFFPGVTHAAAVLMLHALVPAAGDAAPQRAGALAPDGRLWFATVTGVYVIDPRHVPTNPVVPPVHIEEVMWGGPATGQAAESDGARHVTLVPGGTAPELRLPPSVGTIELHYTALSLLVPPSVRFRYRLEGFDQQWVEAGARRVAYYTNLPAGHYLFRVTASNNDGVWNEQGASVAFSLAPRLYETLWFYSFCAATVGLLAYSGYRLHLRQVHVRFQAVLAERGRLAREIHDTLLQSVSGILFQLEAITRRFALDSQATAQIDQLIARGRETADDARRSIWDLRPRALEGRDLANALRELVRESQSAGSPAVRLDVLGLPRRLPDRIERNFFRVAREAVANALKHAQAQAIIVRLQFGDRQVRLSVADDGRGIRSQAAPALPDGHYGLLSMQERAYESGGQLTVRNLPGGGTEVALSVAERGDRAEELTR